MPNKKSGKNRAVKSLGDVTLNDFANSSVCKNRLKKSTSNVDKVLKTFAKDDTPWDEKTDELDGDFIQEIDEDGNVSYVIKKLETRRRRKTFSTSENTLETTGNSYPIDIWFLISEYISPQDVGCFAGICKTSFEVVCTAKFWFTLYKRYYRPVPNLPDELQPECLVRKYSLRTSIIRALHHMYPPFIDKLKSTAITLEEHPDILRRRICECLWSQKQKEHWVYYFKMREQRDIYLQHRTKSDGKQPDLLDILDDVSANPDEHCRILQVTCKHFVRLPPVIGQVLMSVSITLSQGFRHHRMQLEFGSGIASYRPKDNCGGCVSILLDPAISYRVLDWWHPLYPYNHNLRDLLGQE